MVTLVLNFIFRLVGYKEKTIPTPKNFYGFVCGEDVILRFLVDIQTNGKTIRMLERYEETMIFHPHNNPIKRLHKRIDFMVKDLFV